MNAVKAANAFFKINYSSTAYYMYCIVSAYFGAVAKTCAALIAYIHKACVKLCGVSAVLKTQSLEFVVGFFAAVAFYKGYGFLELCKVVSLVLYYLLLAFN